MIKKKGQYQSNYEVFFSNIPSYTFSPIIKLDYYGIKNYTPSLNWTSIFIDQIILKF